MSISNISIVVHGGAGSNSTLNEICIKAAKLGFNELQKKKDSLNAVLGAVTYMENDGHFNAGMGAALGMDGKTISRDASIMDSTGRLGAVAGLQRFKNPASIACLVAQTPHWLLIGEGAAAFAKNCGFEEYYYVSSEAKQRYKEIMRSLNANEFNDISSEWNGFDIHKHWNYEISWNEAVRQFGTGTVGAVARDINGNFAVCTSTGGSPPMLYGRVGDSPIVGCGFYAGKYGAIGATGVGEYIVKQMLAKTVYSWIESGILLQDALDKGIRLLPENIPVGLIGITKNETASSCNRDMATHIIAG